MKNKELKWDLRFLEMARLVAGWSKDPSTKCGAVVVRPDRTVATLGYNGFPRKMSDDLEMLQDRSQKYPRIIHAEMNAILSAGENVRGCTLYTWPIFSCVRCAVHMAQAGISRFVSLDPGSELSPAMNEDILAGIKIIGEVGIENTVYAKSFIRSNKRVLLSPHK